jgi:hypothetical protein
MPLRGPLIAIASDPNTTSPDKKLRSALLHSTFRKKFSSLDT